MPKYDERTSRGWPLPHQANKLLDDVERLRESLRSIDKELNALEERARIIADEHIAPIEDKQNLLDTRMDVIAGQTTEDTEILDARVDAKAEVHPNLGHNIRSLHKQIIGLDEDVEYETVERQGLMKQFNELARAQLQCEVNAASANDRRKKEIHQEALTRGEQDDGLQAQVNSLAQAILKAVLNARYEAEQRRKKFTKTQERIEEVNNALNAETLARENSDEAESQIRLEQDDGLQIQIDDIAKAGIMAAINIHKVSERLRAGLTREEAERRDADNSFAGEIISLVHASLRNALNIRQEAEQRRKVNATLKADITYEEHERISGDEVLQIQVNDVSAASLRNALNIRHETEKRREGFELTQRQLDEQFEQDEYLQIQIDNLVNAIIQSSINFHEALSRRRTALNQEAKARTEFDEHLQGQVDNLSDASLQHSLNIRHEAEQRRKGLEHAQRQLDERLEYDEYLQVQIDDLIRAIVRSSIIFHSALDRRRAALNQETQSRIDDNSELQAQVNSLAQASMQNALNSIDLTQKLKKELNSEKYERSEAIQSFQSQINDIAEANLQNVLNLAHEAERRRKLEQVVAEDKCPVDWSEAENLQIPEPRCAVVNFSGLKSMPTSKTAEIKAFIEFWDLQGNYFKKKILCSAQGSSSLGYVKKNVKFDLLNNDDGEFNLKIGSWVVQDGFHLKAYYMDFFRGIGVTSYKLWHEIMGTIPYKAELIDIAGMTPTANGAGNISDLSLQLNTGALCHPDGFPCIVYLNGEFYGVYSWQIKKQRKNYHMDKSTVEHIHLDGTLSTGNFWNGTINWGAFEIRNPNKLYCMDGKKYDGDAPRELIDETSEKYDPNDKNHIRSAQVKKYIQGLVQNFAELKNLYTAYRSKPGGENLSAVKAKYEEIFDVSNQRDYLIFSDVVKNSDGFAKNWQWTTYNGVKWYVNAYDLDMSFGGHWQGIQITAPLTGHITTSTALPTYYVALLYKSMLEERYKELRDAGIINAAHIIAKLEDWTARIGVSNYEAEYKKWPDSPCIKNYRDSLYRVKKWLDVEIANMDKLYNYRPESEFENLKIDFRKALSIETEAREIHDISETQGRVDETGTLQTQTNDLALALLQSGLCSLKNHARRKNEIEHERQVRLEQDDGLQFQIDMLADANIRLIMNSLEGRRRIIAEINDLKETIDAMYNAVVDTGNMTYKGARIASGLEINELLEDIFSGKTSSEVTRTEIPDELKDEIATSDEITEMLDEIFSGN